MLRRHCRHLNQEKFTCYSLGRENSQRKAQREVFGAFPLPLQSWNAWERGKAVEMELEQKKSSKEFQKCVILTCSEPTTIQP